MTDTIGMYKKIIDIIAEGCYKSDEMIIHIGKNNPSVFIEAFNALYMPFSDEEIFDFKIIEIMMKKESKIQCIKEIRRLGIENGLKEAKELIERIENEYDIFRDTSLPNIDRRCDYVFPANIYNMYNKIILTSIFFDL